MSNDGTGAPNPAADPQGPDRRSPLERALGLFAEVRAGEGANAVLMFANIFLILTAYYVLKVVREGLMIGGVELFGLGGDEVKAYLPAVMTLLLLVVVPLYGALASAVSRIRLLNTTTLFVMGNAGALLAVGKRHGRRHRHRPLVLRLSGDRQRLPDRPVLVLRQRHLQRGPGQAAVRDHRRRPVPGSGARAPAGRLRRRAHLRPAGRERGHLRPVPPALQRRQPTGGIPDAASAGAQETGEPLQKGGGFQLVFQTRYLLLIAAMILVTNVVNTTGEYILSNAAKTYADEQVPALGAEQQRAADAEAQARVRRGQAQDLEQARTAARDEALRGAGRR